MKNNHNRNKNKNRALKKKKKLHQDESMDTEANIDEEAEEESEEDEKESEGAEEIDEGHSATGSHYSVDSPTNQLSAIYSSKITIMETFRGIPISKIREHYMREGYRNEMFSSMVADVIEGNPGVVFDIER
ncbi:hypothetical protein KCU73_g8735, partial [Aureobasidium melanogenum]